MPIWAASALLSKGVALAKLDRMEESLDVFDEVVRRFEKSEKTALLELVARAFFNKGFVLGRLNRRV